MTNTDLILLKAIVEAIEQAETSETQYLYMEMLTKLVLMYVTTKEKT